MRRAGQSYRPGSPRPGPPAPASRPRPPTAPTPAGGAGAGAPAAGALSAGRGLGGGYGDELARRTQRRLADRIAQAHGLTLVDDWPMPLVGLDCFVMAAPGGRRSGRCGAGARPGGRLVRADAPLPRRSASAARAAATRCSPPSRRRANGAWPSCTRSRPARRVAVAVIDSQVEANIPTSPDRWRSATTSPASAPAAASVTAPASPGSSPPRRATAWAWPASRRARGCSPCAPAGSRSATGHRLRQPQPRQGAALRHRAPGSGDQPQSAGRPTCCWGGWWAWPARGVTVVAANDPQAAAAAASRLRIPASSGCGRPGEPNGVHTAPGRDVPTTQPGGRWSLVDGSSYAAAHVSGLVALLRERRGLPRPGHPGVQPADGRGDRRLREPLRRRPARARQSTLASKPPSSASHASPSPPLSAASRPSGSSPPAAPRPRSWSPAEIASDERFRGRP